ncbi:MAG: polyprenyl synthetase family protein [Bdellovibrionales bacterium]|nr:polyprenyl synthetase family protein [Bdellovibrionales bacterium]
MTTLTDRFASEINLINNYLENLIPTEPEIIELKEMAEACRYSLVNPGKRFRALLSLLTARSLEHELNLVVPYAAAVELIHTYSLIHDDLPCMDDDDYRRGQPSHHKVYGEAMAVISGDALQSLAFELIAENYMQMPKLGLKAVNVLAKASGYQGMVGGQGIDLRVSEGLETDQKTVEVLHNLKTGRLIQAAIEGAAILCEASDKDILIFSEFGADLGLAFQVTDDILDHDENNPELMALPKYLGLEKTKDYLNQLTQSAISKIEVFGDQAKDLKFIAEFNLNRLE